jgi:hypothetical protein
VFARPRVCVFVHGAFRVYRVQQNVFLSASLIFFKNLLTKHSTSCKIKPTLHTVEYKGVT